MAQRRMFSKEITNSSEFLMMSQSAQNLYFHFGMNADDDGFCEVFTIMRMTDSKPDDLQSLHTRGFIYVVDGKVCIVKDWHENNQIRLDRYKQSKYLEDPKYKDIYMAIMEEKVKEIVVYKALLDNGLPNGNQMAPQVRLGKGSIVENIIPPKKEEVIEENIYDYEAIRKKYPHARKGKKKEGFDNLKKNGIANDQLQRELNLLTRQVNLGIQDVTFIPAFERWTRDVVATNQNVLEQKIKQLVYALMSYTGENRPQYYKGLIDDFGEDKIKSLVKVWNKEKNGITLNLK